MPLDQTVPVLVYIDASIRGGTAQYGLHLARGLKERGYRVGAICHVDAAIAPVREALSEAGVEVFALDESAPSMLARLRRIRSFASAVRRYEGCLLALIMGYFTPGGPITVAGVLGGAGAIVRADLQPPMPPVTLRARLAVRLKDRLVDRIVVGAAENREAFVRTIGRSAEKIDVVHTGIDLQRFEPGQGREEARRTLGYSPEELVVGVISRLDEEAWRKGVDVFVDMAARIAPAFPNSRFLVIGEGALRERLEQQAEELGIRDRVLFAGWRSDVPELMASMDVFVMPSLFEGGPTTVLEAMAMARPLVATRVGMVAEVVAEGRTGLVVEPGNPGALSEAVSRLLADDDLRASLGESAREHAVRNFSIDRMVEGYLGVFGRAYAERARR